MPKTTNRWYAPAMNSFISDDELFQLKNLEPELQKAWITAFDLTAVDTALSLLPDELHPVFLEKINSSLKSPLHLEWLQHHNTDALSILSEALEKQFVAL